MSVWKPVTAVGTVIAAGAAAVSAWQSQRAASASRDAAKDSKRALALHDQPLLRLRGAFGRLVLTSSTAVRDVDVRVFGAAGEIQTLSAMRLGGGGEIAEPTDIPISGEEVRAADEPQFWHGELLLYMRPED